jgi:uncharacterized protein YabE (DUF348 family)
VADAVRESPARAEPHDASAWLPVPVPDVLPTVDELLTEDATSDAPPVREVVAQPSPARAEPHDETTWLPLPEIDELPAIHELLEPTFDAEVEEAVREIEVAPSPARAEPHDAAAWLPLPNDASLPDIEELPTGTDGADARTGTWARRRKILRPVLVGALVAATIIGGIVLVPMALDGGRDVEVRVDGRQIATETGVTTVASFLTEQKIDIGEHDRVSPALRAPIRDGMTIRVFRAFPIAFDFDGVQSTVYTTFNSPDDFLEGQDLGKNVVLRDAPERIEANSAVVARTERLLTLIADGSSGNHRSTALTPRELLAEFDFVLGPEDYTTPPLDEKLPDNGSVRVTRMGSIPVQRIEPYTVPEQTAKDPNLDLGLTRVEPEVPGQITVTIRQTLRDGQIVQEEEISRIPVPGLEAKPKITYIGTRTNPLWDKMAECETGGNWAAPGPVFQGGLGIYSANWNHYGGREFAPTAGQATREQQIIVAERIRREHGWGAWGCAKTIGAI